jgi:Holliday junction resolvase RusA-like endonuclease
MTKIIYHLPFCLEAKERERSTCVGGKPRVYSPASTKKHYLKVRTHLMHHYPDYLKNKIDYPVKMTMILGITEKRNIADLDNHLKMSDAFSIDRSRKENTGWKGLWKDDDVVKAISANFVYVDDKKDEFTVIEFEPYNPWEGV